MAAAENYDISTPTLTALCSASELHGHIILLITQSINWGASCLRVNKIPVSIKLLVAFTILASSF